MAHNLTVRSGLLCRLGPLRACCVVPSLTAQVPGPLTFILSLPCARSRGAGISMWQTAMATYVDSNSAALGQASGNNMHVNLGLLQWGASAHLITLSKLRPGGTGQFSMSHTTAWVESAQQTVATRHGRHVCADMFRVPVYHGNAHHTAQETITLVRCSGRAATGTALSGKAQGRARHRYTCVRTAASHCLLRTMPPFLAMMRIYCSLNTLSSCVVTSPWLLEDCLVWCAFQPTNYVPNQFPQMKTSNSVQPQSFHVWWQGPTISNLQTCR